MPANPLPAAIVAAAQPLFSTIPLNAAMPVLVVKTPPPADRIALVERVLTHAALKGRDDLAAGLWLYVDDLDRSHKISQQHEGDATFDYWHAIMHRREGDFSNSGYWFRRVGQHPAMAGITPPGGKGAYEPIAVVKLAEAAEGKGEAPAELLDFQRREWMALFAWCAERA